MNKLKRQKDARKVVEFFERRHCNCPYNTALELAAVMQGKRDLHQAQCEDKYITLHSQPNTIKPLWILSQWNPEIGRVSTFTYETKKEMFQALVIKIAGSNNDKTAVLLANQGYELLWEYLQDTYGTKVNLFDCLEYPAPGSTPNASQTTIASSSTNNGIEWVVEHQFDTEPTYVSPKGTTNESLSVKFGQAIPVQDRLSAAHALKSILSNQTHVITEDPDRSKVELVAFLQDHSPNGEHPIWDRISWQEDAAMGATQNGYWQWLEDRLSGGDDTMSPRVTARGYNNKRRFDVFEFDVTAWFALADDDDICALIECEFHGDDPADSVARFYDGIHPDVTLMIQLDNGYECSVDPQQAYTWICVHRPEIAKKYKLVFSKPQKERIPEIEELRSEFAQGYLSENVNHVFNVIQAHTGLTFGMMWDNKDLTGSSEMVYILDEKTYEIERGNESLQRFLEGRLKQPELSFEYPVLSYVVLGKEIPYCDSDGCNNFSFKS